MSEKATAAVKMESIEIKSDGTKEGTTILLNGKPIKDLSRIYFCHSTDSCYPIDISWSTSIPAEKAGEISEYVSYSVRPMPSYANVGGRESGFEIIVVPNGSIASIVPDFVKNNRAAQLKQI